MPSNFTIDSAWKKNSQTWDSTICVKLIFFYLQWSGVDVLDFLVVDVYPHDHVYHRRTSLHKCLSQLEQGCGKHWGKRNATPPSSRKIKCWLLNSCMIQLMHLNLNNIIINCQGIQFLILFFRSLKLFYRIMTLISRLHWITVPIPTFLLNKLSCKCLNCFTF